MTHPIKATMTEPFPARKHSTIELDHIEARNLYEMNYYELPYVPYPQITNELIIDDWNVTFTMSDGTTEECVYTPKFFVVRGCNSPTNSQTDTPRAYLNNKIGGKPRCSTTEMQTVILCSVANKLRSGLRWNRRKGEIMQLIPCSVHERTTYRRVNMLPWIEITTDNVFIVQDKRKRYTRSFKTNDAEEACYNLLSRFTKEELG